MKNLTISLDAGNKRHKRPPDSSNALSANVLTMDRQPMTNILDTAVWLSGNELKLRVTQFYGSRNSKKRR